MKMGEIWGATDADKPQESKQEDRFLMSVRDSLDFIHHKIVDLQDKGEFCNAEDMQTLRKSFCMSPRAFGAVISLEPEYFESFPLQASRMQNVAAILVGLTTEDVVELVGKGVEFFPTEIINDDA
jgi:hypothetical protein